jgi:hypothetical protein
VAKLALENGVQDDLHDLITSTLEAARSIVSGLLREASAAGNGDPGDFVREQGAALSQEP